jgi:hypothetical protein
LEAKHNSRIVPRPNLLVSVKRLWEQRPQKKLFRVQVLVYIESLVQKPSIIDEWYHNRSCFGKEIIGTQETTIKMCPGFKSW